MYIAISHIRSSNPKSSRVTAFMVPCTSRSIALSTFNELYKAVDGGQKPVIKNTDATDPEKLIVSWPDGSFVLIHKHNT